MNKNNYCVIMAGGVGSRFWPMSKTSFPKQFHDVLGIGRTLIQMTYDRFLAICPKENILVVTNEIYKDLVLAQIPDMQSSQVLTEPCMRNTAPCIAYANHKIEAKNPNANIIVAPSDHLVMKEPEFVKIITLALEEATETTNLVTLGIKPTRPDTGYGYIRFKDQESPRDNKVKEVETFVEKPNLETAESYLVDGNYYWNSGIFIWSLNNIQKEFAKHLPRIHEAFLEGKDKYFTAEEEGFIQEVYPKCENISIDYGIMEKAQKVSVVLSNFGWSDLGTWGSLYTHLDKDDNGNGIVGKNLIYDSKENIIFNNNSNKLTVIQGLDNYIVVDTKDSLLICKRDSEQMIKKFVGDVKKLGGDFA